MLISDFIQKLIDIRSKHGEIHVLLSSSGFKDLEIQTEIDEQDTETLCWLSYDSDEEDRLLEIGDYDPEAMWYEWLDEWLEKK